MGPLTREMASLVSTSEVWKYSKGSRYSQLNIGAIGNLYGVVSPVGGEHSSVVSGVEKRNPGLKVAASGLNDVTLWVSTGVGSPMLSCLHAAFNVCVLVVARLVKVYMHTLGLYIMAGR